MPISGKNRKYILSKQKLAQISLAAQKI